MTFVGCGGSKNAVGGARTCSIADPCVVNLVACATPDTYTYWDNLHPTAATGRNMAKAALGVL